MPCHNIVQWSFSPDLISLYAEWTPSLGMDLKGLRVKSESMADPLSEAKSFSMDWKEARGMLCQREITLCCWAFTFKREPARALITTCDETLEQRRTAAENNGVGNLCELELQVKSLSASPHTHTLKTHTNTSTHRLLCTHSTPCFWHPTNNHRQTWGGLSLPLRPGW